MRSNGSRRLSVAALQSRDYTFESERSVSRKELSQAARDAEKALKLRPTLRLVLKELVAVWGEQYLNGKILIWPSNEYLMSRTGLSERAVRYALGGLVELKLISPKDSPNGKRFAIRDREGVVIDAFGFDLSPIYVRQGEWLAAIQRLEDEKEAQGRLHDEITIARRGVMEALSELLTRFPGVSCADLQKEFEDLVATTPRRSSSTPADGHLARWRALREEAEKRYYEAGNAGKACPHIETDNEKPSETCNKASSDLGVISVEIVAEACPVVEVFGYKLRTSADMIQAARGLRSCLGAHESAWDEAVTLLGIEHAAIAVIYVTQLHDDDTISGASRIRNPGGYLRAMIRSIADMKVNLRTEIMALRRRRQK